jgi:hypothetical protein
MKKIKIVIFLAVLIIGISTFASPLFAISPNASHVANCATTMGGQHVADCAKTMDKGVSVCAQMKGPCEH